MGGTKKYCLFTARKLESSNATPGPRGFGSIAINPDGSAQQRRAKSCVLLGPCPAVQNDHMSTLCFQASTSIPPTSSAVYVRPLRMAGTTWQVRGSKAIATSSYSNAYFTYIRLGFRQQLRGTRARHASTRPAANAPALAPDLPNVYCISKLVQPHLSKQNIFTQTKQTKPTTAYSNHMPAKKVAVGNVANVVLFGGVVMQVALRSWGGDASDAHVFGKEYSPTVLVNFLCNCEMWREGSMK